MYRPLVCFLLAASPVALLLSPGCGSDFESSSQTGGGAGASAADAGSGGTAGTAGATGTSGTAGTGTGGLPLQGDSGPDLDATPGDGSPDDYPCPPLAPMSGTPCPFDEQICRYPGQQCDCENGEWQCQ